MILKSSRDPRIIFKMKVSAEVVNNSNVLQNDDDLWWDTLADTCYMFWLNLWFSSSAVADFRLKFTEANSNGLINGLNGTGGHFMIAINEQYDLAGTGALTLYTFQGVLQQAIAASRVNFQWAQATAQVSDTTVSSGSSLLVVKL